MVKTSLLHSEEPEFNSPRAHARDGGNEVSPLSGLLVPPSFTEAEGASKEKQALKDVE